MDARSRDAFQRFDDSVDAAGGGILDSELSMRSDTTLIHPPSSPVRERPDGPGSRHPCEAVFCGSPSEVGYSAAVGTPSYELYRPAPRPPSSFSQNTADHFHTNFHLPPPSPTVSDTTFRDIPSSSTEHNAYPLTQFTKGTFTTKMEATNDTQYAAFEERSLPSHSSVTLASNASEAHQKRKKDWRFWIIFISLMIACILTALDMTMISTALPGIVLDLPVSDISPTWITSSYLLTMTASQPAFGGLSCTIGRQWSISLAVILFLAGSIGCALAPSMLILSIGRGLQGLGGGGIQALGEIIVSDLTTLKERGFFIGLVGLVFAVSSFVAPVLGGIFSSSNWRWIFWLNLPIGAVSLCLIVPFMKLSSPTMTLRQKIERMDLFGNLVLFGSVVGILIGTTEGGITHPWGDWRIWLPLTVGLLGFCAFLAIEFIPNRLCRSPILPLRLFANRTAASAFFQTFIHGIVTYGCIYILPVFFQAIKDESPLRSAISTFPATAPGAPFAITAGIFMALTGKYKASLFLGWALICIGAGWLTRYQVHTAVWELYTSEFIVGVGVGALFAITLPPIQASLPDSELELATATFAFCRSFGSIWGIAIATTIFTSSVASKLGDVPEAAAIGLSGKTALGFVEHIGNLPEPLQSTIRRIFADGIQDAMWFFLPLGLIGFVSVFFIEELPLPDFIRSNIDMDSDVKDAADKGGKASLDLESGFGSPGGASTLRTPSWIETTEKDTQSKFDTAPSTPTSPTFDQPTSFAPAVRRVHPDQMRGPRRRSLSSMQAFTAANLEEKTPRYGLSQVSVSKGIYQHRKI